MYRHLSSQRGFLNWGVLYPKAVGFNTQSWSSITWMIWGTSIVGNLQTAMSIDDEMFIAVSLN